MREENRHTHQATWDLRRQSVDIVTSSSAIARNQLSSAAGGETSRRVGHYFWSAGLLAALGFLIVFFSLDLNTPWTQDDYYNGAVWSQAAHNLLRAGLLQTAGVPAAFYYGPLPIPPDGFYVHHPCLLPLSVAASFGVFGESEWAARIVPLLCSTISAILVWILARSCAGVRAATFSLAVFVTLPMELHYGQMVNFEPVTLMWMLAALLSVRYMSVTGNTRWWISMIAACVLAMWTAWLGYFFVVIMALHFAFFAREKKRAVAAWLWLLALLSALAFLVQIRAVRADAWSDLATAFYQRLSASAGGAQCFTMAEWTGTVGEWLLILFSPLAWALALGGGLIVWKNRQAAPELRWLGWAALCLVLLNGFYLAVFRNASYIHDYAGFYLVAPIALMAGLALDRIAGWKAPRRLGLTIALVMVLCLAYFGVVTTHGLWAQSHVLDESIAESPRFIPSLGQILRGYFDERTEVLCNFAPQATTLPYYAQRSLLGEPWNARGWTEQLHDRTGRFGSIIWMGGADATELLEVLPKEGRTEIELERVRFCLWKPSVDKLR
jgi:4-amino-4-deoxy-L-arabinose transferase-like glycosyltransferase